MLCLLAAAINAPAAGDDWKKEADARIEHLRKRDARIQVVDANNSRSRAFASKSGRCARRFRSGRR